MASVRRLSAIMFTDMVGSTAAAHANEAEALKLRDEQAGLVRSLFAAHHGREIKSMGDGFLAEFDSALRAVQCAVDIQQHLHERNSQSGVTPIRLRIGIHLGDVEQRETDIFGDAVNIASRIEPLASPGGVCISGEVFSQVRNKIPNQLEKLPSTPLKGLESPIDIYRVVLPWDIREPSKEGAAPTGIAILPFTNISPDPKDEYFADGLTEELITVLSQLRDLRVISRTSVMLYKATPKSASQIGMELGVASILEGSVRKAGNRLRVTAQLIDARSDRHLWAKTYDRDLDDIFAIQSELAQQVSEALKIELRPAEGSRLELRPTVRPVSYLAYLKGLSLMRSPSPESMKEAKEQFEFAILKDERNAAAHAGLSRVTEFYGMWHTDESKRDWYRASRRSAARAIEIDPDLAEAHLALAVVVWDDLDWEPAEREFKIALSLNPSFSEAHSSYALYLVELCRTDEALAEFTLAEEADPLWAFPLYHHAILLTWLGRFDEAAVKLQRLEALSPHRGYHAALGWYHLARGKVDESLREFLKEEEEEEDPRAKPIHRAWCLVLSGETEQAMTLLRQDSTLAEFGQNAHFMAQVYAEIGDLDECFRLLDKAVSIPNIPIFVWRLDPRLEKVRRDPRFQEILRKAKLD